MRVRRIPMLLIAAGMVGCSADMGDLRTYVAEVKARKSSDIEPIPQIREYEPFTYRANDQRSPFEPFSNQEEDTAERGGSGIRPDRDRANDPLEAFSLDSLRMAGTLSVAGTRYALVKGPDGVVHRVTVGEHMGQNYGEIVAIDSAEVRLIEIVPDGMGGYMKRNATVALSE